ncbi:hypothetical protein Aab01nite_65550 [Paractinoplanes abujensis]|uniref:Uncharacterized protein n=1 Tax=Paractinoplanes abujensis TaxID=882441 RepID=A0A7W7CSL0_9ACTN|nr:hypothetical protein [Actinoplanes abujensis]MBB4692538.1 hypothetical protein [Actinoplanes abujensis]GID22965.1 hypothetical protein Aab01nite_65550 [Actinoplanes abujensis]
MKRRSVLLGSGLALTAPLLTSTPSSAAAPLTNTAHLDFLRDTVTPPAQAGHSTAAGPVGVLWTYAEPDPDGTFRRIGGGPYDATTDTYGQGAFNSDDIARAAVVYVRHFKQTGSASSRAAAHALLRGLAYFQTLTGPHAGNFILWMQPDGTFNPSPEPVELPDPSDSGPSYWLARAVWALGEGYAAFRSSDPGFAAFLRQRLELALGALEPVLARYRTYQVIDGQRLPAWLIVDGADATAEAVLGLSAYVSAGGASAAARRALRQFSEGIAALAGGGPRTWPFGAVLPWALSLSDWHAWASQMPAALARAGTVLDDARLVHPAVTDAAVFTPWLLTSGGPDNGRLPARIDRNQIAYGVDSRLQSLLAVAATTGRAGFRRLAGIVASWYFGANAAGAPAYDPATGRTVDGIAADGTINRNAGAESTIHGLLSMLALDAHPDVAAQARQGTAIIERVGSTTVEAESAALTGGATVVTPPSAWTGESQYSEGKYAQLPAGSTARFTLPASSQPQLVMPIVDRQPGSNATTRWTSGGRELGTIKHRGGAQGKSPAPGALLPITLNAELPTGRTDLVATSTGGPAVVDAVLLEPLISRYVIGSSGRATALLRSAAQTPQTVNVTVAGSGPATIETYDAGGVQRSRSTASGSAVRALVLPGGFSIVRR